MAPITISGGKNARLEWAWFGRRKVSMGGRKGKGVFLRKAKKKD